MDVEIDNLEIKAGSDKDDKEQKSFGEKSYSEKELQLMIEKCVERAIRQLIK